MASKIGEVANDTPPKKGASVTIDAEPYEVRSVDWYLETESKDGLKAVVDLDKVPESGNAQS